MNNSQDPRAGPPITVRKGVNNDSQYALSFARGGSNTPAFGFDCSPNARVIGGSKRCSCFFQLRDLSIILLLVSCIRVLDRPWNTSERLREQMNGAWSRES